MSLTRQELLTRLAAHEDSFVERKPENGEHRKTLVAFANSVPDGRVAVLFIGIGDDGLILGLSNADSLQKKLRRICSDEVYPTIRYTTELLEVEGRQVLAVVVPPSSARPHFAGPAYVRVGSESIVASAELFDQLVSGRHSLVRELLKYAGQAIIVSSTKAKLGKPENEAVRAGTILRSEFARHDCTLIDVNPFFARFETRGTLFSEPLRNLVLSYDEEAHKPLVIVRLDGA